jgi:glutamate-1-semialdehyde aminotransferase/thioesterase domain-containing protein/acyl carrier protein
MSEQKNAIINSSPYNRILSILKSIFEGLLGVSLSEIDIHTHFLEMGISSLLLLQISSAIKEQLGILIPFRLLLEDFPTINALAIHITQELSPEALMAAPSPHELMPTVTPQALTKLPFSVKAPADTQALNQENERSVAGTAIEQLMAQQLQVMSKQLNLLHKEGSPRKILPSLEAIQSAPLDQGRQVAETSINTSVSQASQSTDLLSALIKTESHEQPRSRKINFTSFANSKRIEKESIAGLSPHQQKHLDALIARFVKRTQESKRLTQAYRLYHANSRAITGFLPSTKEILYPIHAQRGAGARLWDVDGNEYVDISMGFGALLFGHSPSFVIEAVQKHIKQGIQHGPQSRLAGQVAELICELTGADRVAFCTTGTEAVMGAIRLARAATGRSKIALFAGSFHGTSDEVLVRGVPAGDGTLRSVPVAPGIPQHMTENVMVLKYGSPESLDILKVHAHELAAILVEPVQSGQPDFQPKEFLHQLRQLTKETETVLIFDEVVTGFRVHPGGVQAMWDIQADITTYGKAVGAGMPIGVVAGKAAFMDALDGGFWSYGDASYPQAETTVFKGTFFKHPLVMSVAWAALNHMKNSGPKLQEELAQKTTKLADNLNNYFQQKQLPIQVINFGSLFSFTSSTNLRFSNLFYYHLLEKGVYVWEGSTRFLSTAHTDEDIDRVIWAVKESVLEMQKGEFLPSSPISKNGGYTSSDLLPIKFSKQELEAPLVKIQPQGSKRPLFFIHSMGGNVLCYNELARCLGSDQPFYGLQAPGLYGEHEPHTRIEDMATHYIIALRVVQPEGPYFLGSWSMGSFIAFEMAQQLQKQGHQVALLSLLDSPAPDSSNQPVDIEDDLDTIALANFAMDIAGSAGNNLSVSYDKFQQLEPDEQLNYVLEQLQMANLMPANVDLQQFRLFSKVYKSNFRASKSYVPQVYPNRMIFFRASDGGSDHLDDPSWGWSKLSSEPVETLTVPGNHYTMLAKPHVQVLAEQLKAYLNEA